MNSEPNIGVFGGTFDPIHIGHLVVAEILQHELGLEQVIFLPAGRPPHKPSQVLASDIDRVEMLKLAIVDSPSFSISLVDLERPGYSYTSMSLEILSNSLPEGSRLHFLMGQDSLRDFPNWHRPDLIAKQAILGVAQRPGFDVSVSDIERLVPETRSRIEIVSVPLIGIASHDIRDRIGNDLPYRYQVLPAVADYIGERNLYHSNDQTLDAVVEGSCVSDLTARRMEPYTRYSATEHTE